jgi:hypothetical protein
MVEQRAATEGSEFEHAHPPQIHAHDHYHVSHYHKGGPLGEWEHRTHWHTHEHNHAPLTHCHDYDQPEEAEKHGKMAHVHDHARPTESPA